MLEFNETLHEYKLKGKKVPSVTEIVNLLDDGRSHILMQWARERAVERMSSYISRGKHLSDAREHGLKPDTDAMRYGSRVHRLLDAKMNGEYKDAPSEEHRSADAGIDFLNDMGITPIESEVRVHHDEMLYAGTADLFGRMSDGRTCVIDWKTSRRIYTEYHWQVTAYLMALTSMGKADALTRGFVVQLPKGNKKVYHYQETNVYQSWKVFCQLRELKAILDETHGEYWVSKRKTFSV